MSVSSLSSSSNRPAKRQVSRRRAAAGAHREIVDSAVRFLRECLCRDLTVGEIMVGTTLSRPTFHQTSNDLHDLIVSRRGDIETIMHQTADPSISGEGEPITALRESLRSVVETCFVLGLIIRAVAAAAPLDERLEQAWTS